MYGKQLLSALMGKADGVQRFLQMNPKPEWFLGTDKEVYSLVMNHVTKFGAFPGTEAMGDIPLPAAPEVPEYYLDQLTQQYLHTILSTGISEAVTKLNGNDRNGALERLQELVMASMGAMPGSRLMDYAATGQAFLMGHIDALQKGLIKKTRLGWPSLDNSTGGLMGGDVVTIVGRPANGKSFMLFWSALEVWQKQEQVPLVVSMEMDHLSVVQRLASMQTDINLNAIKTAYFANLHTKKMPKHDLSKALGANIGKQPFWIVDGGMSATIEDIMTYAHHLKPDIVYIDGAYLVRALGNIPRWERVTAILERIKGDIAAHLGIPVVISFQFNREGAKKQQKVVNGKPGEPGLEDIGYTDAVGQISSVVLGMLEEPNVEQLKHRKVSILKGRDGQKGQFHIKWRFEPHMGLDFSEAQVNNDASDLNYI